MEYNNDEQQNEYTYDNLDKIENNDVFQEEIFYSVSIIKFIVLSFFSFGIYNIFWLYKNWKIIKQRELNDIHPIPRAIFGYFFIMSR